MRNAISIGLLALLGLLPAATARAWEPTMEVGAFAGLHLFNDDNSLGRDTYDPTSMALQHTGAFGLRVGLVLIPHLTVEAELALAPTKTNDDKTSVLAINYRGHAVFYILTGRVRPFVLAGVGAIQSSPSNPDIFEQETLFEAHAGVGLAVDVGCHWGVRLDGRLQFEPGLKSSITEDGEILLAMYGRFGGGAEWGANQRCKPPEPPPPPPAPVDSDGDGVPDTADRCPHDKGPKDNGGCPDSDRDGDGVVDRLDKCPDEPGPKENDGCPWPDTDHDGVVDKDDKCPQVAGPVDNGGCPWPDSDGDGILDKDDKCPNQPETKNGFQDDDGCPDEVPAEVKALVGPLAGVGFDKGKATITKASTKTLDAAAKMMKAYPSVKVELRDYTDEGADHDASVALSQGRAEAVKAQLVARGVDGARVTAKGLGPEAGAGAKKAGHVELQLVP